MQSLLAKFVELNFPGLKIRIKFKKLTNLCNFSKYNKQDRYEMYKTFVTYKVTANLIFGLK